jgi:V/A-type H+-transporting ATPase subunit K
MDTSLLGAIGDGASFGFPTLGSAIAIGMTGSAAIGAWKKCYMQNRPAPFIMVVFAGTPLTNVIYGFITMTALSASTTLTDYQLFVLGTLSGLALGIVGITQATCSAHASDSYAETGQGFANALMVIGIAETISLLAMVFTMLLASAS